MDRAQGKLYINGVTSSAPFLSTSQIVEVRGKDDFLQFYLPNRSQVRLEQGELKLKALRAGKTVLVLNRGKLFLNVKLKADQYFDLITDYMRLELTSGYYYLDHNRDRSYFAIFSGVATHIVGPKREKVGEFRDLKVSAKGEALVGGVPQTIWERCRPSFQKIGAIIP